MLRVSLHQKSGKKIGRSWDMSYNVSVQERQRSMSITISSLGSGFWVVSVFEFRLQATVPCKHSCAMEFARSVLTIVPAT